MTLHFDTNDQAIVDRRRTQLDTLPGPRVGDFVEFADGTVRRISETWGDPPDRRAQTSDGGNFYLGEHGVSFSGSLYPAVPADSLTATGHTRPGAVWIFHHDHWRAHHGVHTTIPFRVYTCELPAPR